MTADLSSLRKALRTAAPWAALALALAFATAPIWRRLAFGFQPALDDLLQLRCFGL